MSFEKKNQWTGREIAKRLNVSYQTIKNHIAADRFGSDVKHRKVGHEYIINANELIAYLGPEKANDLFVRDPMAYDLAEASKKGVSAAQWESVIHALDLFMVAGGDSTHSCGGIMFFWPEEVDDSDGWFDEDEAAKPEFPWAYAERLAKIRKENARAKHEGLPLQDTDPLYAEVPQRIRSIIAAAKSDRVVIPRDDWEIAQKTLKLQEKHIALLEERNQKREDPERA